MIMEYQKAVCLGAVFLLLSPMGVHAQFSAAPDSAATTRTTFVRLSNNSNAILVEPLRPEPARSRIAVIVTHPERINNFNYFIARTLPTYGYPTMAINYYGPETSFYELLAPIAAAIKALKAMPGIEKVVLAGHSSGGAEVSAYQDVAENGPAACQRPERIYKCSTKEASDLPKADAMLFLDPNSGAPERTFNYNPAVAAHSPRKYDASLDMFAPQNGYDPKSGTANYRPEFLKRFFAAQVKLVNGLIDEAKVRLDKIEKGEGDFAADEPFTRGNRSVFVSETRPELAYIGLLAKSHAPHLLLKPDGSRSMEILNTVRLPERQMRPADAAHIYAEPDMETVRQFLSSFVTRLNPDYHWTENGLYGIDWHSSASSLPGNTPGIHVPTLFMSGTCAAHIVFHETAYDRSGAKDKEYVGVEGANHGFQPCKPEFGDTYKRTFDFVDSWLTKPGRL
jgi:pimeloyl-ACP methyl ester carboxylesterase